MAIEDFYEPITRRVFITGLNSKYETTKTSYTDTTINGYIGSNSNIEIKTADKDSVKTQYNFYSDTECNYSDEFIYKSQNYRLVSDMHDAVNKGHHFKGVVQKIDYTE